MDEEFEKFSKLSNFSSNTKFNVQILRLNSTSDKSWKLKFMIKFKFNFKRNFKVQIRFEKEKKKFSKFQLI